MTTSPDQTVRRRHAAAVLYADICGFTALLDHLESEPDGAVRMGEYLAAWERLRDALVRDPDGHWTRFYLANRAGDAFVVLVFERDARRWFGYVAEYLGRHFAEFAATVRRLHPEAAPHLKVSLYTNEARKVPYFETGVMRDEVAGGYTIARRDFLCTAMNKCARLDAMPEADRALFLCNAGAYAHLVAGGEDGGGLEPGRFADLGMRELRGFRTPERLYAFELGER
jgi:class 3 adenylate cyclase